MKDRFYVIINFAKEYWNGKEFVQDLDKAKKYISEFHTNFALENITKSVFAISILITNTPEIKEKESVKDKVFVIKQNLSFWNGYGFVQDQNKAKQYKTKGKAILALDLIKKKHKGLTIVESIKSLTPKELKESKRLKAYWEIMNSEEKITGKTVKDFKKQCR